MKKKFLKIVVGITTTFLVIFSLFSSKASVINNNFGSYILDDTTYEFKDYSSIITLNDLKGTFWVLGFDGYEMSQNYFDELFGISFNYNSYTDARRIPFVLQPRNSYIRENVGYIYNSSATLSFLSLNSGSSFYFSSLTDNPYLGLNLYNIVNDNGVKQTGSSFNTVAYLFDYSYEMQFVYDISFSNNPNQLSNFVGFNTIILCFPNSNEYTINFTATNPNTTETTVLYLFKKYCTQITPSSFDNLLGQFEYTNGYDIGYYEGYDAGSLTGNNDYRFAWLTGILNSVSDILSLEIFPNVKLSYFIFIPLVLGVVGMIFWFWRKD